MVRKTLLKDAYAFLCLCTITFALTPPVLAQAITETTAGTAAVRTGVVPPVVRFAGTASNRAGDAVEAVFSVYAAQEGGEPLWSETQRIFVGPDGRYSVLLGSASHGGIPGAVFSGGEGRWLGVSIERAPELARTPLVSVAYAMKAGDAETLGGFPVSQLVTRAQWADSVRKIASDALQASGATPQVTSPTGTGTVNMVPLWKSSSTLGNSILFQGGTAAVPLLGVNTVKPVALLDVAGTSAFRDNLTLSTGVAATAASGVNSPLLLLEANSLNVINAKPNPEDFAWQAVPTNNNSVLPSANLDLLFGANGAPPAPTGLQIAPTGVVAFVPGQTFPGTVTGVTAGQGLTGAGSAGNLSLAVDHAQVPLLSASNAFTSTQNFSAINVNGNQTLNGYFQVNGQATFSANVNTSTVYVSGGSLSQGPVLWGEGGLIGARGSGSSIGLHGVSASTTYNSATGAGSGVFGTGPAGVSGTGSQYGVSGVSTSTTGIGVYGGSPGTTILSNGGGSGVVGHGAAGVAGYGTQYGLFGVNSGSCCAGIYGTSSNSAGTGVLGLAQRIGVQAQGVGSSGVGLDATGVVTGASVAATSAAGVGTHSVAGAGSKIYSKMKGSYGLASGVGVWADTNTPPHSTWSSALLATADGVPSIVAFNNGPLETIDIYNFGNGGTGNAVPVLHAGGLAGDCLLTSNGDSICTGAHKSAVSVSGGSRQVEMYAVHAAENWFEDFATAQLVNGAVVVKIDPAFAETINGQIDYHVFLTPRGDCEGLYVTNETPTSFEVHELRKGTSNVAFDYRITARRAGQEKQRMVDVTEQMRAVTGLKMLAAGPPPEAEAR